MKPVGLKTPRALPRVSERERPTTQEPVVVDREAELEERKRAAAKLFGADIPSSDKPLDERIEAVDAKPTDGIYLSTLAATPEIATVVASLYLAKRILVVSHVPPDGDCVGSALGLTRALRALGKSADTCIDDDLPAPLRAIDDKGDVKRAHQVKAEEYDAVVLVDVAAVDRIGGAAAHVKQSAHVIVLDHHEVEPDRDKLGIGEDVSFHYWIDPRADSASLLVSSVVEILADAPIAEPFSRQTWASIARPLAAGAFTDTEGFTRPGTSVDSLSFFKHHIDLHLEGDLDDLEQRLDAHLPAAAQKVLDRLRTHETGRLGVLRVPRSVVELALAKARETDPKATEGDVLGPLFAKLNAMRDRNSVAVMLLELPDGKVKLCTRSKKEGPALEMAKSFGGGGHAGMAAAVTTGTLDDVEKALLVGRGLRPPPRSS